LAVRWSQTRIDGERLYHKKIVGTVEQYPDEHAARRAVAGLVSEINTDARPTNSRVMTVAQLCDHFEQRELSKENTWRSHATKKIYKAYLIRWIRPYWGNTSCLKLELFRSSPGFADCH
jgi:integrase